MHWLKTIVTEIFAIFVDDGAFALVIILWLAAMRFLLPLLHVPPIYHGAILFAGLAMILIESAARAAIRKSAKRKG